jgi:RNA polymerase sigma-70 factor (ECF subfamily)
VLRQLHGDRQAAEDIVQETLLRAWTHPDALDPDRGSVRAWLFAVARNLIIDSVRAKQARPREVGEERLGEDWAGSVPDPGDDAYEQTLDALQMAEALGIRSARSTARCSSRRTIGGPRWPRPRRCSGCPPER